MTALLELKQRIKNLYSQYEIYILPVLRFVLAMVYFIWINTNMGYMKQIDNIFIVLILALICSILPSGVMIFVGFALMVAHGYALGIEVAGFMLVLILFMAILFLRFSSDNNLVLVFTPLSFGFSVPTLLPIGSGLLCNAFSALPAGCGVIIYYFIRFIRVQHKLLENPDVAIADKLKLLTDGIVQNWGMWITVIAFIAVILLVNLIRTRSFDYAWRIAIIAGGVVYVLMIIAGGFYFRLDIDVVTLIIYTVISVVIGLLLEFFVFGGDYTRTERLEYEDDEYYYYVKAIPKVAVTTPEKTVKKINERQETEIIDAEAVKRLSQDVTEETKAISVEPSANHKLRKETSRKTPYNNSEYRSPAQIRASQAKRHSPKRGPMPKKHDMKDVDKLLLTQSLENEFHASGKKTANKRKR